MMTRIILTTLLAFVILSSQQVRAEDSIKWQPWSDDVFKTAAKEHKLVLLDLGAVWCHWCHVMDNTTYSDKTVIAFIEQHYIPVRVDQDSQPALSHRYEDYGWPATVIFNADGAEIVKRRGYIEPATMQTVLKESFENPVPSKHQVGNYASSSSDGLTTAERDAILSAIVFRFDEKNGGWGDGQKFLSADMMEFGLNKVIEGNRIFKITSEKSLAASYNLIDPVWGGVYQYSDMPDWKSPHFEKILSIQSAYILSYSYAYSVFKDVQYRDAANKVIKYLDAFMTSSDGAFYTSQDADISEKVTGHDYYALSDEQRHKIGLPRLDTHIYASENGNLISSLIVLYAMTGDESALHKAERAATWLYAHRALKDTGGFTHDEQDKSGPFLSDTLAMAKAMLDLYAATADRAWLTRAQASGQFIITHFADKTDNGFFTEVPGKDTVLKPYKHRDENISAARFFNLLSYYAHDKKFKENALSAIRSVTSPEEVKENTFSPGLLLANDELQSPPLHLTVVGPKDDPAAQALFKTALAMTPLYKQTEWFDKKEGNLPGADIEYPTLAKAAVFVCTNQFCSLPIFDSKGLIEKIEHSR